MADVTVTAQNWMSGVKGDTPIRRLSIPGTHESCALYGYGQSQCQWLTIPEQLDRGIRFLDVRCVNAQSVGLPDDDFWIYHGLESEAQAFSSVQQQCVQFLIDNPSEAIFMNVQREAVGRLINRTATEFMEQFLRAMRPYAAHWSFPSVEWTLDRCRGQIILIRSGGADGWPGTAFPSGESGLEWHGFAIDGTWSDAHFQTQNGWKKFDTDAKKLISVKQYLDLAADESFQADKIYINFLSRAAGAYVGSAAQEINRQVQQYLESGMTNRTGRLGVLPIDFVGNTGWHGCLEDWIIRRNPFKDGYSFRYAISPFKLQLGVPGSSQRWWLAAGQHDWAVAGADPLIMSRVVTGGEHEDKVDVFKADSKGTYLSVSEGGQVGLYSSGTAFFEQQHGLVSKYAEKPVRMHADHELWCDDEGLQVEVAFAPA